MSTEDNFQIIQSADGLAADVRSMIADAREAVAQTVNAGMTLLYWRIGRRIQSDILRNERAEYGKEIVSTLSRQLVEEFGNGFSEKSLRRMLQFAEVFPDGEIVVSLIRHLSWTHILALIPLKQPLQRDFYAEMCRVERWSVRTLRKKIGSMLYERTAISKKPEEVAKAEIAALRREDRLILCAGRKEEQIELLELDRWGIHVAEYLTALPPRELLQKKLHAAIVTSRARLANRQLDGEGSKE